MIKYSQEIKSLITDIEVPDSEYEKAVNRYHSVSKYLVESGMKEYLPDIYLQGSFKLGTAIKPLTEDGSYDIDLICTFTNLHKNQITQAALKKEIGKIICEYAESYGMRNPVKDGKRCWTVNYVDQHNFHLDILPSVPNDYTNEIAITDKNNASYEKISADWEISNPKEYYVWFINISKFDQYKKDYALNERAKLEEVPYYKVKTPLQRIVQILKRHAEVMFDDNMEYKPSSIIITTLAAKAYESISIQEDFLLVIQCVVSKLNYQLDLEDGKPCVLNPIDRRENLSIKWKRNQVYYTEFLNWIDQSKFDFSLESSIQNANEKYNLINRSLHKCTSDTQLSISLSFLPYHLKSKWKENIWKAVSIKATVMQKGFTPKNLRSGQAVGKGADITFEVKADYVELYEVYWQITNTGYKAQRAKQLRGDFYESSIKAGKKVRTESTSYTGRHYVEAFLVQDEKCVGRSAPFEVNIVNFAVIL